jgi:methyl-accepting chemotaxis protein
LAKKFCASFGTVLVLLGAVAATGFWATSRMASSTHEIASVAAVKATAANTVNGLSSYIHESQTRFVLTRNKSYSDHLGDVQSFEAGLAALARRSVTASDHAHLATIRGAFATVRHFDDVLHADVSAGRLAAATAIVEGPANDAADALANAASAYQAAADEQEATAVAQFASTRTLANWLMGAIAAFAILAALVLAYVLLRAIRRPLAQVQHAADAIADGDLEQTISVNSHDEIGQMAHSFANMLDYLRSLAAAAEQIAAGDLTVEIDPRSEHDTLRQAFARMATNLRQTIGEVARSADAVASTSQQMATTSQEVGRAVDEVATAMTAVAHGAERQVQVVASARSTASEVIEAMSRSAHNATAAATVAEQARSVAEDGIRAAQLATDAMQSVHESSRTVTETIGELDSKSEQIGAIVATITTIAAQTNLLALNAAIEAARAGEQGRGFAVVAEEVRKLAEDSQNAAGEISGLIEQIQGETSKAVGVVTDGAKRTNECAETVEQTRTAFQRIAATVADMSDRVELLATEAAQMAAGGERIRDDLSEVAAVAEQSSASSQQVSASTEQTSASTQQISASAQHLATIATELETMISQFKVTTA